MATQQQPIQSGFGDTTTASQVISGIDLNGKVIIVTGGGECCTLFVIL